MKKNIYRVSPMVFGSFIFGLDSDKKTLFKDVIEFMNSKHITG